VEFGAAAVEAVSFERDLGAVQRGLGATVRRFEDEGANVGVAPNDGSG
jgi:hypothetical protein